MLTKPGHQVTLSIPDHAEVSRVLLAKELKKAGISEKTYLKKFR